MRHGSRVPAAIVALALLSSAWLRPCEADASQKAVEERLTCQCGCGLTVHTCNHLQCSFAVPVKTDIAQSLAADQSLEEILDRYVDEYGEKILSSPIPRGFNLLAWIAPYVAVLIGGVWILLTGRRWRRRASSGVKAVAANSAYSDEVRQRLQRELEGFEP